MIEKRFDSDLRKKVLITGAHSYIGTSFAQWANEHYPQSFLIDTLDLHDERWEKKDFSPYDAIFHVAGIAHRREKPNDGALYYLVNRDLVLQVAAKAKAEGVKQFVFLSSMSVYGLKTGIIKMDTQPLPDTHYGESKLQAEMLIKELEDTQFHIAILRPPMVYGKGCKGNYQRLRAFALRSTIYPDLQNRRSMLYVGNLCEFVCGIIRENANGLFFPQNEEYVCTSELLRMIAAENNHRIIPLRVFNPFIRFIPMAVFKKAFGNLIYETADVVGRYSFEESVHLSESGENAIEPSDCDCIERSCVDVQSS